MSFSLDHKSARAETAILNVIRTKKWELFFILKSFCYSFVYILLDEVRNIALDGQGGEKPAETKEKLLAVFKKEGVAAIRQQIAVFAAELSGFARDPSSFKHTS